MHLDTERVPGCDSILLASCVVTPNTAAEKATGHGCLPQWEREGITRPRREGSGPRLPSRFLPKQTSMGMSRMKPFVVISPSFPSVRATMADI